MHRAECVVIQVSITPVATSTGTGTTTATALVAIYQVPIKIFVRHQICQKYRNISL